MTKTKISGKSAGLYIHLVIRLDPTMLYAWIVGLTINLTIRRFGRYA